ncbi:MAG TPA: ABC transporter ATP-binding protein [Dongiaceae bacterium]
MDPLLKVQDLQVSFPGRHRVTQAVRGISFELGREKLGIVGESGSGKSLTCRALMGIQPEGCVVTAKEMRLGEVDLLRAGEARLRGIRGRRMSMIMQDPKYSLNPVLKVGLQIAEAYRAQTGAGWKDCWSRALEMLQAVRIREPERVMNCYPHEISGGMGQRAMIAMMLISSPEVLIADEPTSALDVTVQSQVLDVLNDMVNRRKIGLIFISHDLNLVASFCTRVLVMYAGRVLETLDAHALFEAKHPYTRGLLGAIPSVRNRRKVLPTIERDPDWLTA